MKNIIKFICAFIAFLSIGVVLISVLEIRNGNPNAIVCLVIFALIAFAASKAVCELEK